MPRIIKLGIVSVIVAMALMFIPTLNAQQTTQTTPAPVPAQIAAAKRVFIANATGETVVMGTKGRLIYNPTYDEFYAALKGWGRYELVSTPADSDLVFELHLNKATGVFYPTNEVGEGKAMQFQVVILDPKTRVLLWEISQGVVRSNRDASGRKNFTQAMTNLVDSVKKLSGQPVAAANSGLK